jgi:hypothetical protein
LNVFYGILAKIHVSYRRILSSPFEGVFVFTWLAYITFRKCLTVSVFVGWVLQFNTLKTAVFEKNSENAFLPANKPG